VPPGHPGWRESEACSLKASWRPEMGAASVASSKSSAEMERTRQLPELEDRIAAADRLLEQDGVVEVDS